MCARCMHNPSMASDKRRKPGNKNEVIPVRLTKAQKATLVAIAKRKGMGVSTWLLSLGLAEAEKAEGDKGSPPKTK